VSSNFVPGQAGLVAGARIGDYRLEQRIGRGGMAVVFRATDERHQRVVALKVLSPGMTKDHAFRTRFIRESRSAAAVDHPNILPVYDSGEVAGYLFMAMRFIRGGDVRGLLRQAGQLPIDQAWRIVTQIASALDAAHAVGLVHRDVKPANMLLDAPQDIPLRASETADDHPEHVYLSDFGVSKQVLADSLTATGQIVGTLDYMAPEQIEGATVEGRTDLYALACTTFELLCGVPPFRRDQATAIIYAQLSQPPPSLAARRPELPPAVDRVLARALAKKPAERQPTCSQFAAHLGWALELLPARTSRGKPAEPAAAGTDAEAAKVTSARRSPAAGGPDVTPQHHVATRLVERNPRGAKAAGGRPGGDHAEQDPEPQPPSSPPGMPVGPEPPTRKRDG
jgi:serine/threonine protein kinase